MKNKILLIIPALLTLSACSFLENNTGKSGGDDTTRKTAAETYLETSITVSGEEKDKDSFLASVPDYSTISPETKNYNYCTVNYSAAKEMTGDQNPGHPSFLLTANHTETAWFWEINVEGNDVYQYGPEAINKTASEIVAADPISGDARECRYIVGQDVYYFASRSTQVLGKYTYYRRYEYKFNQFGDVVEADSYEGYTTSSGDSFNSSRHSYTVAFSIKQ